MKQIKCLFVLVLFILGACSNEQSFILKGESENWSGVYNGYTYDNSNEKSELTLSYKGDYSEIKGNIKYEYETDGGGGEGDVSPLEKPIKVNVSCGGCAVNNKDDVMTVTVSWNNKSETFKLQSKK